MSGKTEVLDHGYVRLVDSMGSDDSIVRNARVSHDGDTRTGQDREGDEKLIHYLYSNGHNTPFEGVVFTFEIKCPIFIARQWHRHRTWSYNEISARYAALDSDYYVPSAGCIGVACDRDKQSSNRSGDYRDRDKVVRKYMHDHNASAFKLYYDLLARDVPRELARTVLPVATYTRFYGTVNLHNLFRFLHERQDSHAQYEIRCYADAIYGIIKDVVPTAVAAYDKGR